MGHAMNCQQTFLIASDSRRIPVTSWRPDHPRATLVIAHGMAEYAERYAPLAQWLCAQGVQVVAADHRGHGPHCAPEELGHFGDEDGWNKVVSDLHQVIRYARNQAPDLPLTLFGHSMGSFIAQACAQQYGEELDNLVLCATNRINRKELCASRVMIAAIRRLKGLRHRSSLISDRTFGAFNREFQPNRTSHDWLSRDPEQVDRYLADPLCGFECSSQLWSDFIGGMLTIDPRQWRKDLPVHLIAGSEDPVGEMGHGVSQHCDDLHAAGVPATFRLYHGARHELINETNASEVWQHLISSLPIIDGAARPTLAVVNG